MPLWRKLLRWLAAVLGLLAALALLLAGWFWLRMRASLPPLDGARPLAGLAAPVTIARDALGVPTITGSSRPDVARATGFLHAQDRFFQMDLLRRRGAGELAELFGPAALDLDREARLHTFRRTAREVVARGSPEELAVLRAYTEGVNAGLAALAARPWEYLVLRTTPQPWREEDSILCAYAMWFDLQDHRATFERNRDALRVTLGQATLDFLAPRGNSWDAALDGSTFPPAPLPTLRFTAPPPAATTPPAGLASLDTLTKEVTGSNAFALAGTHTTTGAALVANDMHLGLGVPNIWYRTVLRWTDPAGPHRVVGVTLPGWPSVIAGSNGRVAWGFTDAYIDTTDLLLVAVENTANSFYQTPDGWKEIEDRHEQILVKGADPVPFTARWTRWGPLLTAPKDGRALALRWTAHDPEATNLAFLAMETVRSTPEAVALAHRASFANENLIVGDTDGTIAWTILGRIPRRIGYDGRLPASWGYGDRRWDGYLPPHEIPVILNPPDGLLWTGNNRAVGGDAYAKLGDSGYDDGARGGQIRDGLRALATSGRKSTPADLLAIQLDDRALFLARWQKLLLHVLNDDAVAAHPARAALRDAVRSWRGHASTDSVAYRAVRAFRLHTAERAFAPFARQARKEYPDFSWRNLRYEDALWQLVHDQPPGLLNPEHPSWPALLLAAADAVIADADKAGGLARFTWGARNTLALQHPFSRFLPKLLARHLDLPAEPVPGDADMPRVQGPRFGQSERFVVSPGHEDQGLFHMPGGQSGHPLSPFYRAGHAAWVKGEPTPLLPGPTQHTLTLTPP
jgi:penicillin amidase